MNVLRKIVYFVKKKIAEFNRRKYVNNNYVDYKSEPVSFISCNCIGGMIYHDLKTRFASPTINLYIESPDFISFCMNLNYYLSKTDISFIDNTIYPIGKIDNVLIHFLHYKTNDEALECWKRRAKRVNYENIKIIFSDRDNFNESLLVDFYKLPYKKVFYSHINYPLPSVVFVEQDANKKYVSDLTKYSSFRGERLYEKYIDINKWVNVNLNSEQCLKRERTSMYVVTHRESDYLPESRCFVGVGGNQINNVVVYDNFGNNISYKNKEYCELTALYWIWKNDTVSNIVSFEHYRRFFCKRFSLLKAKPIKIGKVRKILKKYDVIVSNKFYFNEGIYDYYKNNHNAKDLDMCREIISAECPEFLNSFDYIMLSKSAYMCNMFIISKKLLNEYCEWLFNIFDILEKKIDISNYDTYQRRVFGFLSERLLNVWIFHKGLKTYELPIYFPNDKPIIVLLKRFVKKILHK